MCSVTGASCTRRSVLWRTSPSVLGNSDWQTDTLGICHTVLALKVVFMLFSPALREYISANTHTGTHIVAYALLFRCSPPFVCREIQKKFLLTMQLALISFSMKVWKVWKGNVWYLAIHGECVVYRALEAFSLLHVSPVLPIRIR